MIRKKSHMKKTALISAMMLELAVVAQADTIVVDNSSCVLNDAVIAANTDTMTNGCDAGNGADVIELPSNSSLELSGTLMITSEVTINGNGSTVSGPQPGSFQLASITSGFVTINDVTLQNGYDASVGGVSVSGTGNLTLNRSTVKDTIGGGISLQGWGGILNEVTIENTGNSNGSYFGAALSVVGTTAGIMNSTIVGNNNQASVSGGAIWTSDYTASMALFVNNSTISGNTSANQGGGISHSDYNNYSFISVNNSTIVNNTTNENGGGLSIGDADRFLVNQSLVSGNSANGLGNEIHVSTGGLELNNYNILGQNGDSGLVGITAGASDIVPSGAVVGTIIAANLADNGGLTETHALLPGTEAVDAIPSMECGSNQDQTGKARPIDGDGDGTADCDVGAFEYNDVIFADGFD